jgi:GH24 family phage-related lysozyme (muramidase)
MSRVRIAAAALTISAAAFATWQASEGFAPKAEIPTKGDVPTIGHGSTHYEDGTLVKMGDTITPARARELAMNLAKQDCAKMAQAIPGVALHQEEYDVYCDFTGQYGIGNWRASSMRGYLMDGKYIAACKSLLRYRFAAGYDCSTLVNGQPNKRCWGVWTRQKQRFDKCMGAQ